MWIRKSQKRIDIETIYKMYSLKEPILTFLLSFVILDLIFISDNIEGIPIIPFFSDSENILYFYIANFLFSLGISIFSTWYRIKKGNPSEDQSENSVICFKCFKPQSTNNTNICACGGKLVLLKNVEYLNEEDELLYKNTPLQFEEARIKNLKKPFLIKIFKFGN